jgi:hypothetical protein
MISKENLFFREPHPLIAGQLPAHRAALPGKEAVCFFIAPLIPACRAGLAGCVAVHIT